MRSSLRLLLPFVFIVAAGCGGSDDPRPDDTQIPDTTDVGDTADTGVVPDDADSGGDAGDTPDVSPPTPAEVVCRECDVEADCGGGGNLCLSFADSGTYCGYDCTDNPSVCPDTTRCIPVVADESISQCVLDNRLCVDLCETVECDAGQVCDPFDGSCIVPRGLCEPCDNNTQCGTEADLCLTFADEGDTQGCARDCTDDPAGCPDDYVCVTVTSDQAEFRQCIPAIGTCIDRCETVVCDDEGDVCNPRTGECNPPKGLCEPCTADFECGTADDRCLGLTGAACATDRDCLGDEFCDDTGTCVGGVCGLDCAADASVCPAGSACFNLTGGGAQCLPLTLSCVDRCADVTCDADENCDHQTGECVPSVLGACNGPCDSNAECGGQDDLCLSIGEGARCYFACGDGHDPCPLGYDCLQVFTGSSFCLASNLDFSCNDCVSTACPDGEQCHPVATDCYPRPEACIAAGFDCGDTQLCNTWEDRCEPVGTPCTYEERYYNCDFGNFYCTAPAPEREGTCEENCFGDGTCQADRPECVSYHGISGRICVSDPIGGAHTCGERMPTSSPIGRPCTPGADPTDPALCPDATTDTCLADIDPTVPPFCTVACTNDEECGGGAVCADAGAGRGSYCLPDACACAAPIALADGEIDVFGALLDLVGTSRCAIAWSIGDRRAAYDLLEVDDAYRLTSLGGVLGEPLQATRVLDANLAAIAAPSEGASRQHEALALAAAAWGVTLPGPTSPVELGDEPLFQALVLLFAELGVEGPDEATRAAVAALPDDIEAAVASVVADFVPALDHHQAAFAGPDRVTPLDAALLQRLYDELVATVGAGTTELALADPEIRGILVDRYRRSAVLGMADVLIAALDRADWTFADATGVALTVDTPIGAIVVAGTGDDDHAPEGPIALLVDLGGNDTYRFAAGANASPAEPIGIVVDLGGDDTYGYDPVPHPDDAGLLPSDGAGRAEPERLGNGPVTLSGAARQGAGRLGFGALYDLGAGADGYVSLRMSQGFGLLGVGVLFDDGGDDELEVEAYGQGAGAFGVGIAVVGDGVAALRGVHGVQGFGGVSGVGVLVGGTGSGTYVAAPGDPLAGDVLYYDPLVPVDRNFSAAQGAGVGARATRTADGRSASGGLGVLLDLGGDDTYEAGMGAQGFGHWHGVGLLRDLGGADVYTAHALAAGAAIHFGAGALVDHAGDDRYGTVGAAPAWSVGYGEDFAGGVFVDRGGADRYTTGGFAIGFGSVNGAGLAFDLAGNDTYTATSNDTLGRAVLTILGSEPTSNPRRSLGTWGLFVDAGGTDTYARPDVLSPRIGDGASWRQTSSTEAGLPTFGGGVDGDGATGVLTD